MPEPRQYEIDPEWEAVLRADPCAYCGAPTRDLDHIVPVTCGGDDTESNLTASCGRCNKAKRNQTLLTFLWKRVVEDPPIGSPRAGVYWRKDLKRWAAYVDCVRRYQLGHYATSEAAVGAVESWWRRNPEAMSPRARRVKERRARIRALWEQGLTQREIAETLGIPQPAAASAIYWLRKYEGLPRRGRGAPGRKRKKT